MQIVSRERARMHALGWMMMIAEIRQGLRSRMLLGVVCVILLTNAIKDGVC